MDLKRSGNGIIQITAVIVTLVLCTMLFAGCASVTAGIGAAGPLEIIEQDVLPFTAPESTAQAKAAFENGHDIDVSSVGSSGSVTLNCNLEDKGIVGVRADVATDKKLKAKVSKGGNTVYYNITPYKMEKIPLQYGDGAYSVALFENLQDKQYQQIFQKEIHVSLAEENSVYLYSSQVVNFDGAPVSARLSAALTRNTPDDTAKLSAVYTYVITHITYDYDKIKGLDPSYIPSADEILESRRGICYDYAAVMAVMLRQAGIPAKLVKGYRAGLAEYHAWNEVYANGKWITVDATFDAAAYRNNTPYQMEKEGSLYRADKVF